MPTKEYWTDTNEEEEFAVAANYLTLFVPFEKAQEIVDRLRAAPIMHHLAVDVLRETGNAALAESHPQVVRELEKVDKGRPLSPVLLVRVPYSSGSLICEGYYRICAIYCLDEVAELPCRLVDVE